MLVGELDNVTVLIRWATVLELETSDLVVDGNDRSLERTYSFPAESNLEVLTSVRVQGGANLLFPLGGKLSPKLQWTVSGRGRLIAYFASSQLLVADLVVEDHSIIGCFEFGMPLFKEGICPELRIAASEGSITVMTHGSVLGWNVTLEARALNVDATSRLSTFWPIKMTRLETTIDGPGLVDGTVLFSTVDASFIDLTVGNSGSISSDEMWFHSDVGPGSYGLYSYG